MLFRLRSTVLAGGGALLLVLSLSGVVAAASILTALAAPVADPTEPVAADTTATFEDINGDGIDDDCQTDVVETPGAGDTARAAIDLNGDWQISVSEAAQSGWIGGKNCNHGGYVSGVAHACDATAPAEAPATGEEIVPVVAVITTVETTTCADETADAASTAAKAAARAEKDAAKLAAKEARLAAKEARIAAREARAAERTAAKAAARAAKVHGKAHKG